MEELSIRKYAVSSSHYAILLAVQLFLSGLGVYFLYASIQYGEVVGGCGSFLFVVLVGIIMSYARNIDKFEAVEFQTKILFHVEKRVIVLTQDSIVRVVRSPSDGLSTCELEIDGSPINLNSRIENLDQLVFAIRRVAKIVDDPRNLLREL